MIAALCCGIPVDGQKTVTGRIIDEQAQPLRGATVSVKGRAITTTTSTEGVYSILANDVDTLVFSHIGYLAKEMRVGDRNNIDVTLTISIITSQEVFLTGYSSQRLREITASVEILRQKDLAKIPEGQVEQMLQGQVAGLTVISSGMPGAESTVRLHGIGNFGDATPIYIIDGIQGNVNNLNPADIESIQVLKDAGAYAVFGVRGGNGVIIITTKSGKPGKTKINFSSAVGLRQPPKGLDLLNPSEMANLTWIALKNSGQLGANGNPDHPLYGNGATPVLPDFFIAGANQGLAANDPLADPSLYNIDYTSGNIYQIAEASKNGTDWYHLLFKPALSQNHSVTVSGGNERNTYLLSLGYLNQQGTLLNTYLKRYNLRVNTEFAAGKRTRIGENIQLTFRDNPLILSENGDPTQNDIMRLLTTQPILPVYDIKGGWAHMNAGDFADNPVASRTIAGDDKTYSWEILGNVFAETDLTRTLKFRSNFGGNFTNYYSSKFTFSSYAPRFDGLPNNALTESSGYRRLWTWTNTLELEAHPGKNHSVKMIGGIEALSNFNHELGGQKSGFFTNDVNYRFLTNGSPTGQSNYSFASLTKIASFISKIDYGYKDRLFFSATVRNDGASVFGPANRHGWFPSFSTSWILTDEKFLSELKWLTDLKIRASWGKTGFYGNTNPFNQYTLYGGSIGNAYYDIFGTNSPAPGFRTIQIGDTRTGWQEDVITNIGLESTFWSGRLNFTANWYNKKSNGLLFPISLPDILGGATPPNVNVGSVQNKGVDLSIGSKGEFSPQWHWMASLTAATYKNRIVHLNDIPFFIPPFSIAGPFVRNETGHSAGAFYGYKIIGIFRDQAEVNNAPTQDAAAPGRFRYLDANNDKKIDDDDRVFIGDPNPDFTLGLNIGLRYKQFDFSAFFYGSFGNEVINVPKIVTDFFLGGNAAKSKALLYNSWTPQHTNTSIPIVENDFNFSNISPVNSYTVENGTYFRNKVVNIGYQVSGKRLEKARISSLRIFLQLVNLFTLTQYSGLDPELAGHSAAFGIDFGNYPGNQPGFILGLNLNF